MKTIKTITYFDSTCPENAADCATLAVEHASELGLTTIVAASSGGATAREFAQTVACPNIRLVIVTHAVGFSVSGVWEFDAALAKELWAAGHTFVCGTHALSGALNVHCPAPRESAVNHAHRSSCRGLPENDCGRSQGCGGVCAYRGGSGCSRHDR